MPNSTLKPLNGDAFAALCKAVLGNPDAKTVGFLYGAYCLGVDGFSRLAGTNKALSALPLNHVQLLLYIYNEHLFYLSTHGGKEGEGEGYVSYLVSAALDKYATNEHLSYQSVSFSNRFNPEISTISLYLNFILGMLSRYKKGDPANTLVVDVMNKAFQLCKCIVLLLTNGFPTEAFSTWRTLHENECILLALIRYGNPAVEGYLRHLTYAMAFRGGLGNKEKTDACFLEIKEGMHAAGLKSKDMKRFIEYGWLLNIPDISSVEDFKLNFRDGVERIAGLHAYSKVYEMSSELAHSSPLLIYSRKNYFHLVAMLNLYESFFRLEKVFSSLYLSNVDEGERNRYKALRQVYFPQLLAVHEILKARLKNLGKKVHTSA